MADSLYRWEEVTTGKKVFWGICVALILFLAVGLAIYGRGVQKAKLDRFAEQKRKTEEDSRKAAEKRAADAKKESEKQAFNTYVKGLDSIPGLRTSINGNGYIKGKVVVIDKDLKSVDSINNSLPTELRATTASEVGTVVWLDWRPISVGSYTTGGQAYYYTCQVSIIDKSIPAKVGIKYFRGSDPPSYATSSYYGQNHYGSKPTTEITTYLTSLPRR